MRPAHALALALIPLLGGGGAVAATFSRRVRDALFFILIALAIVTERMDVHFFSEAWYRGTTRGIEVSFLELAAFSVLVGSILSSSPGRPQWKWPAGLGFLLIYAFYAAFSVLISEPKLFGVFELSKILAGLIVFLAAAAYVRTKHEWTILLTGLSVAVGTEGLWAIKQRLFTGLDRAAGSLDHPNSLSMYFCLGTPLLAAAACAGWSRRIRLMCGAAALLAAAGELLTVSRAGVPVFAMAVCGALACCLSWRPTVGKVVAGTALVACLVALVAGSWGHLKERYEGATLEEEYFDPNVDGRGIYLRLAMAISHDHFFGVGLNNWSYHVSRTYGPKLGFRFADYDYLRAVYGDSEDVFADSYLAAPAHNLGALTLGELGVPGLILFTMLWIRWFSMAAPFFGRRRDDPRRMLGVGVFFSICGIFGQSLTEWVYRQTPILFTFHVLLGAVAALAASRGWNPEEEEF